MRAHATTGSAARRFVFGAAMIAAALFAGPRGAAADELPAGHGFDFYVLSLSWSPSYCAVEGEDANRQQCGRGRPYAFVVHGLWPQFEHGYPDHCKSGEPDRVPKGLVSRYLDLMPSAGLIGHQWRKHGTCTGLSQADYFRVMRAARQQIAVPPAYRATEKALNVDPDTLEADFVAANPGLKKDAIAVTCDGRYVREVRICMTKELGFRPCPEVERGECRRDAVEMPPSRGE